MLQTVNRVGRLLDLFDSEHPEWGATAVAKELDIAKSQAHELLVTLTDVGLLARGSSGRYRLGWRSVALGSLFLDTYDLGREASDAMRALVSRYGESLQLAVWGPGKAVCIAAYEGRHSIAVSPWPVGARLPGHSTGAGKVLLASRPSDEVHDVLARDGLERMTDRTIVTTEKLREELAGVRRRGFACENEEHALHVCGVAAPIRNAHGDVVAAVGMSVPAQRWQRARHEYTRAVVTAAARVPRSPRLGSVTTEEHDAAVVRARSQ